MSKEKQRFLFFKYVPEKKGPKSSKEALAEPIKEEDPVDNPQEESKTEHWPDYPECPDVPGCPDEDYDDAPGGSGEDYPDDSGCPDEDRHEEPECPGEDHYEEPECPEEEYPKEPECPEEEYPEEPECPELPEEPECPEPEPEPEPGPCPENSIMHIVKKGDTYWKLARKYKTTVEAIEAANPGVNPLNLQIGQELCIPLGLPGARG